MRNPLIEIKNKYYNSNDYILTPRLLQKCRKESYGMNNIKIEAKHYYEVMADSKSEQVYLFLKEELQIENEAKILYKIRKNFENLFLL